MTEVLLVVVVAIALLAMTNAAWSSASAGCFRRRARA
jgi:hypothetical protein